MKERQFFKSEEKRMNWPYMCGCREHVQKRKNSCHRKKEATSIAEQYPDKLPLIVERFNKEKSLPTLDIKYLVPFDMTIGTLSYIIRNRLQLSPVQAIFLLVNNHHIYSSSHLISEIYREEKDEDGFLYISYASQEAFG